MLVSYADPSAGHSGVIYRAANWKSDGRTDDDRKTPRFDYADANSGKKYSRASHIPIGTDIKRVPRVSKWRFIYSLTTRPPPIGTELIARPAKDSQSAFEETARSVGIRFDDIENHENQP